VNPTNPRRPEAYGVLSQILLLGLCTLMTVILVGSLLFLVLMPINNYHQANGVVDFQEKYEIVSRAEGVITRIGARNGGMVAAGDTLLVVSDERRKHEIEEQGILLQRLKLELGSLEELYGMGAVDRRKVEEKAAEIRVVRLYIESLRLDFVIAPVPGTLAFNTPAKDMGGVFVEKGESIGYIYDASTKLIRISFPNSFADRFAIGSPVLFRHKDPASLLVKRMKGRIQGKFIDTQRESVLLYCEVTSGREQLGLLGASTVVQASILINSTSFAKELVGLEFGARWFRELKAKAFDGWY